MSWFGGGGGSSSLFSSSSSQLPPTSLEKVRASYDNLVYEAFVKTVEVVLVARLTPRALAGCGMTESGHKTRVSKRAQGAGAPG